MKKKIIFILSLFSFILLFIPGKVYAVDETDYKTDYREYYQDQIDIVSKEIDKLENQISNLESELKSLDAIYQELSLYTFSYTMDDLTNWFNKCNDAKKSVVSITRKEYNVNFALKETTSDYNYYSGAIIKYNSSKKYYYVLTTYDTTKESGLYFKTDYIITDGYNNEYSASIYNSSSKYNLAILYFSSGDKISELNTINLSQTSIQGKQTNELLCNLYYLDETKMSHLNFSKFLTYKTDEIYSYPYFVSNIDKENALGSIVLDYSGQMIGITVKSYYIDDICYSYNMDVSNVNSYLKSISFVI